VDYDIVLCRCECEEDDVSESATPRRDIGPVGTAARVVGGLLAIAVPIAMEGLDWWDVGAALVALPLIATAAAALVRRGSERYAPHALAQSRSSWSGPTVLVLGSVVGIGIALTFVTPLDGGVGIWSFLGCSMLVAALRGQAGCEVLAIPNALTHRADQIDCVIYTPIDTAEARRTATAAPRPSEDIELLRRAWDAFARGDVDGAADVLDADVRWYGADAASEEDGCHNRDEALAFIRQTLADGVSAEALDFKDADDRVVVVVQTHRPPEWGERPEPHGEVVTVRDGKVVEMVVYPTVGDALTAARKHGNT
jgi:ketosteroid isomerase-like protein